VGDEAVLRRMTVEPWRRFADSLLRREYAVQQMLQNERSMPRTDCRGS